MRKFELLFAISIFFIDLFGLFYGLFNIREYAKYKKIIIRNKEMKSRKKNTRCYILGLGPSLKDVDFSLIDGDSIVVNHFYKFDKKKEFTPTFYCLADECFGEEMKTELINILNSYKDTTFFLNDKVFSVAKKNIENDSNIFCSYSKKGFIKKNPIIDLTKNTGVTFNVVSVAISLSIYLKYDEIILLGYDYNSFASTKSLHCYNEDNPQRKISLAFDLFCNAFTTEAHYRLAKCASKNKIQIINATPGSLLDAYTRDEDFLNKRRKK